LKRIGSLLLVFLLLFAAVPASAATKIYESGWSVILHADSNWYILDDIWYETSYKTERDENNNLFIAVEDFSAIFKCNIAYNPADSSIYLAHNGREVWQGLDTSVMFVDTLPYPNPAAYISALSGAVMIPAEPYASVLGYVGSFSTTPEYAPGQLSLTHPAQAYTLDRIEVNKAMQMVTVYGTNDVGYTKPMKYFLCRTGNPTALTPNGTFYARPLTYAAAGNPWYYFKLHDCWILYCTQLFGDICFHSVTFNTYGVQSLSQSAYNNLGHPASHGCIRLMVEDAKFIWENCGGLPVDISEGYYDESLQNIKQQLLRARSSYSEYVASLVGQY